MKRNVSPAMLIVAIVLAVALVGYFGFKTVAPQPEKITMPTGDAAQDGREATRAIFFKKHGYYPGQQPPAGANPTSH